MSWSRTPRCHTTLRNYIVHTHTHTHSYNSLKTWRTLLDSVSWLSHSMEMPVVMSRRRMSWRMRMEVILLISGSTGSEDTDVMSACIPLPPPRHVCELPKQEIWVREPPASMFQRRRLVKKTVQLKVTTSSGHTISSRSSRFKSTVPKQ